MEDGREVLGILLAITVFFFPFGLWALKEMFRLQDENKRLKTVLDVAMRREQEWRRGITPPLGPTQEV